MLFHLKPKRLFLLCSLIVSIFSVILISSFKQPKLYTELIINTQNNVDLNDISLFFTDVNYKDINVYHLTPTGLSRSQADYVPYSEGFLEKETFNFYQDLFRKNNKQLTSIFQTYYETPELICFAFPGDLNGFKILEKATHTIHDLKLSSAIYTAPMYVSHMVALDDQLIILAGEARSYSSLIYVVDLSSFQVISSKRLKTHPTALDTPHCTLTDDGKAFWIAGDALQVYDPLTDKEMTYPMPFSLTGVTSEANTLWAYRLMDGELKGILSHTSSLSSLTPITLTLPTPTSKLIDLALKDSTLAVALYDPMGSHFTHYIVLYNLKTHTLFYCLGISPSTPLILAKIGFTFK